MNNAPWRQSCVGKAGDEKPNRAAFPPPKGAYSTTKCPSNTLSTEVWQRAAASLHACHRTESSQ